MLRATYTAAKTGFKLWAPTATDVKLITYKSDDPNADVDRTIDMVVNIPKDLTPRELSNGYKIRRAAIDLNIPLITNARLAIAFINAFCTVKVDELPIKSWDEYA